MTRGQRFREAREAAGIGLNKLAELAQVNKSVISLWENDERDDMKLSSAVALAKALSTSVDWIATGEHARAPIAKDQDTPGARARAAAVALGYPDAAIDAGLASAAADNEGDPWEILTRIRMKARIPAPGRLLPPPTVQPYAANEDEVPPTVFSRPASAKPAAAPAAKPKRAAK